MLSNVNSNPIATPTLNLYIRWNKALSNCRINVVLPFFHVVGRFYQVLPRAGQLYLMPRLPGRAPILPLLLPWVLYGRRWYAVRSLLLIVPQLSLMVRTRTYSKTIYDRGVVVEWIHVRRRTVDHKVRSSSPAAALMSFAYPVGCESQCGTFSNFSLVALVRMLPREWRKCIHCVRASQNPMTGVM